MSGGRQFDVEVIEAEAVTPAIRRLRLARIDGEPLPAYSAGSHTVVTMHLADRTIRNAYSLLGATLAGGAYEIAVLRTETSRGGSAYLHAEVGVGSRLSISPPLNLFALNRLGRRHILVAGGVGITPMTAMAEELAGLNLPFELHYAMRGEAMGAFAQDLLRRHPAKVRLYASERGERLAVRSVLEHQPLGTHLYVCGPERMIDAVLADASAAGWPSENVHAERFLAPAGGAPFAVRLSRSGLTAQVGEHQSLLEAIEAAGVDAPYLCRGGACGQCETRVLAADGALIHNDHYLSESEKAGGQKIMTCVSRLQGHELVVDL